MNNILVVDPVCAQELGHNLAAMRYFISSIKETGRFKRVQGVCAGPLAGAIQDPDIDPFFHFNYHHLFNIDAATDLDATNVQSDRDYVMRSQRDFERLISKYKLDESSTLFFPSADYYAIVGALLALKEIPAGKAPRVILRMIAVLDHATRLPEGGEATVAALITECLQASYDIKVIAETPAYASELSARLGIVVPVAPYPVIDELEPISQDAPLVVAALGSGRYDKGFLRLNSIFRKVIERAEELPVKFVVQNLPSRLAQPYVKYISELSALPGLYLANDVLEQEDLTGYLRQARVIVTPYAQDVYALRGSAMLMEALSIGRPNVGEAGCGFSSQIAFYDCGKTCKSDDEYANAIVRYLRMEVSDLNMRMAQARARFVFDSNSIYASLW